MELAIHLIKLVCEAYLMARFITMGCLPVHSPFMGNPIDFNFGQHLRYYLRNGFNFVGKLVVRFIFFTKNDHVNVFRKTINRTKTFGQ